VRGRPGAGDAGNRYHRGWPRPRRESACGADGHKHEPSKTGHECADDGECSDPWAAIDALKMSSRWPRLDGGATTGFVWAIDVVLPVLVVSAVLALIVSNVS
jgi:hypothetical protein